MLRVSANNFCRMRDQYRGYCPDCEAFTRGETEPDAEGYDCPICDGQKVMGAEAALIDGHVEII